MSFKDQLEATVQKGRDCNAVTAEVKKPYLRLLKRVNLAFSYHLPMNMVIRCASLNISLKMKISNSKRFMIRVKLRRQIISTHIWPFTKKHLLEMVVKLLMSTWIQSIPLRVFVYFFRKVIKKQNPQKFAGFFIFSKIILPL